MLTADDPRWHTMLGGYRVPFDPRALVAKLELDPRDSMLWNELSEESYHQGDIGEASYVAVVLLAQSVRIIESLSWELLSLVSMVELARGTLSNPPVPGWLQNDYQTSMNQFADLCSKTILDARDPLAIRGMLAILAFTKGFRVYASAMDLYSEDELTQYLPD